MATTTLETTIPFSGFYESIHDSEIDYTLERIFQDENGLDCEWSGALQMHYFDSCDFRAVHKAYAQAYTENFAHEFKIPSLAFIELSSPREYNFTTDRVFCTISLADVDKIMANIDHSRLADLARETFTSRSGFSSFYNPDVTTWGPVDTWDHNQIGTLLQAYADQEFGGSDGFDSDAEFSLMESDRGNAMVDQWLDEATPEAGRLYRIHQYLLKRLERQEATV